jgi:hypothetical protein
MATERQIAANRQNARKSTGPRSRAGRKRASRNSYRHGLSSGIAAAAECAKHVEDLARKIAGRGADAVTLEIARSIARAELDLVQIRRVRVALIARLSEFGELEMPNPLRTSRDVMRFLTSVVRGLPSSLSVPVPPSMPSSEPERSAEAMRRALPELLKLDRYERRATARRDRASREIVARRMLLDNL